MLTLIGVAVAANAQTATYNFTGVITSVQGTAFDVSVGTTITGTYLFNYTPIYNSKNDPTVMGVIGSTTGWSVRCCAGSPSTLIWIDTINGGALTGPDFEYPRSSISSTSGGNISANFGSIDGAIGEGSSVALIALAGETAFSSNGLPNVSAINLSASSGGAEIDGPPGDGALITYTLTSFTLAPTPTTALKVTPTTAPFGTPISLTASVTAASGEPTPTGTVTFVSGTTTLGIVSLNGTGEATLTTTSLASGTDPIVARYTGSYFFNASTSATVKVTIISAPVTSLTPSTATFPATVIGAISDDYAVTLKNSGSAPLSIKAIGLKGAQASSFRYISECGASLAVGKSCLIYIGFAPKTSGRATATLSFSDNAPESPQAVTLTGTGVAHAITVAPTALVFSPTPVGGSSLGQSVTLTNTVTTDVVLTSIVLNGADPGDFVTLNDCGAVLAAGAICNAFVAFNPTKAGKRTATLSVTDDAGASPQVVTLTGTGN
jgi:hypothetical protein